MTTAPDDLTIRPITGLDELARFARLPYVRNDELATDLRLRRRRPGWMWLALREGRPVARAAWWARSDQDSPDVLDIFDISADGPPTRVDDAGKLLAAALARVVPAGTQPPEFRRLVPPDWRDRSPDRPESRQAVEDLMSVLEQAGAQLLVERLELEWRSGTPVPPPAGRLEFRPVTGRDQLCGLMTAVLENTLDAHARRELARMTPRQAAEAQYAGELERYLSPREWWRVAALPGGEPAGFVIPAHNGDLPIIAYIGVLPAHRGRGYAAEILAEGTRILADQGVARILANTDLGNGPMAAAFARTGWITTSHELCMTWD